MSLSSAKYSSFPNGFANGVTIRGIPLAQEHPGKVFYVNNSTTIGAPQQVGGSNGNKGTIQQPFSTIDFAIGQCTAGRGDIIFVMPGHAETLASASAITADVAGVAIVGMGEGSARPTLSFSDTAATLVISAANVSFVNMLVKPTVDSVVSPIVVSGANVTLDYEHADTSSAVEAVRAILTTATADNIDINLKYSGFIAGNATVNAIRLVGADGANVDVDFYGVASTSIVEFHTTACHNVKVSGNMYNSGTTDLSKNVVDTVTGSTWSVKAFDAAAAVSFSGGSAAAVASDDVAAVTSNLGGVNATTTDSINGKIGTDTEMADSSLFDMLAGVAGVASFPAAAAAANGVSMAEVLRYLSELQVARTVLKTTGDLTAFGTSLNLFTVTGDVLMQCGATVDVAVTSTSGTTTLEVGVAGNTACLLAQDAVDNTAFDVGDSWTFSDAADVNGGAMDTGWVLIGNGATVILTGSVDDITAGDIDIYARYIPLTAGSSVVAA